MSIIVLIISFSEFINLVLDQSLLLCVEMSSKLELYLIYLHRFDEFILILNAPNNVFNQPNNAINKPSHVMNQ